MRIEDLINIDFEGLISINYKFLDNFIHFLRRKSELIHREPFNWIDDNYWLNPNEGLERNSQYFAIGNSINFRFWEYIPPNMVYVKGVKGGIGCQGSRYMWRCLKVCIDKNEYPILDASFLSSITFDDFCEIFKTDYNEEIITDLNERFVNWRDLGKKLIEKYKGKFYELIIKSKNSIENFIKLSSEFRAFDDPLFKITMVNAILHRGRRIVDFKQGIFPGIDYHLVTQAIRLGLLDLNEKLENKIKNRKFLNTVESKCLRFATLKCLVKIGNDLNIGGDIVDNIFFRNGKKYCTHNMICNKEKNICIFEKICKKRIELFMPLEITRYY